MTNPKKTDVSEKATKPAQTLSAQDLFEVEAQERILESSRDSMEVRRNVYKGLANR